MLCYRVSIHAVSCLAKLTPSYSIPFYTSTPPAYSNLFAPDSLLTTWHRGALAWEVKADPRSGIKEGCPVVAIVGILLPHSSPVQATSLPQSAASTANGVSDDMNSRPLKIGIGLKCGIVAADNAGVVTVWDLAVLASKSFGSKGGPSCLLRLCLYDHPAVLFQLPNYGYDNGPISRTTLSSTGATVVGLCPFPRSTEPEDESVPKGLTDSKDNDILCVTFSNGRVMLLDLMKRRIGGIFSTPFTTCSSAMLVLHIE